MAELIGTVSAIAGLIQVAGACAAITYSYLNSARTAKKEIQGLYSELNQISGVLVMLKGKVEGNPESALAIACLGGSPATIEPGMGQEYEEQQEIDAAAAAGGQETERSMGKKPHVLGKILGIGSKGKGKGSKRSAPPQPPIPQPAIRPAKPFDACEDLLKKLEKRLKPGTPQSSGTDRGIGSAVVGKLSVVNKLLWPLEKKETMECVEKMERLKNLFTLAMTADQMTLLNEIKTFSDETTSLMRDAHDIGVRNMRNIERLEQEGQENAQWRRKFELDRKDSFRSGVLKWLSIVDSEANHRAARSLWQPGTGEWFVRSDVFQTHLEDEESFMWLHGIPGAGKTVLMSSIITETQNFCANRPMKFTKYFNLAYFYFDFRDSQKMTVENMMRSLLRQFADLLPGELPREVEELHEKYGTQSYVPVADLRNALRSMMQDHGRTFINIDALDECSEPEALLDFIQWLKVQSGCQVQFLATGRRDAAMEDKLTHELEFVTIPIQTDSVDADVQIYVVDMIASDPKLKLLKTHVKEEIVGTLVKGARGMFRWVQCQLDSIRQCRTPKQILASLKNLPRTLDDTYEAALMRIRHEDEPLAIRAFQWLSLAFRPLTVEQLAEAVIVEEGDDEIDEDDRLSDPRDILDVCGNLITVDPRSRIVSLAHFSVQEYLLSERARNGGAKQYAVIPEEGHEYLLSTCLTYLQLDEFDTGPARRRGLRMDRLVKYPMAFYAANNWFNHAKVSPTLESKVFDLAPKLFGEFAMGGSAGVKRTYCFNSWMQIFTRRPHGLRVKRKPGEKHSEARAKAENFAPSPLFVACALGLTSTADTMITHGCGGDIDAADRLVGGTLTAAVDGGHYDMAKMLIDRGANPRAADSDGRTPLHRAAKISDDVMVKLLLASGADPLAKDNTGWNALHIACACVAKLFRRGSIEDIVKVLVDAGCSLSETVPDNDRTPIYLAVQSRNADAAWALVTIFEKQNGTNGKDGASVPEDSCGKSMLHWASFCGKLDSVKRYLMQSGANAMALDLLQRTPLHDAVDMGNLAIVEELLSKGKADVFAQDHRGHSSMAVAGMRGNLPVLTRLLRDHKSIDPAILSQTLAVSIFARRNLELARFLLELGADPNAQRTSIGRTVLQLASQREDWPLVDLLTEYGGRPELFVDRKWAFGEKARMQKEIDEGKEPTPAGEPVRATVRMSRTMSEMTFDDRDNEDSINLTGSVGNLIEEEDDEDEEETEADIKAEVRAEINAIAEVVAEVEAKIAMEEAPPPFEEGTRHRSTFKADVKMANAYDPSMVGESRHVHSTF